MNHILQKYLGDFILIKIKKYDFIKKELKFLRHIISRKGIRINLKKIKNKVPNKLNQVEFHG